MIYSTLCRSDVYAEVQLFEVAVANCYDVWACPLALLLCILLLVVSCLLLAASVRGSVGTSPVQNLLGGSFTFTCSFPTHLSLTFPSTWMIRALSLATCWQMVNKLSYWRRLTWLITNNTSHCHLPCDERSRHFTWQSHTRRWQLRRLPSAVINSMYMASPNELLHLTAMQPCCLLCIACSCA